MSAIFGRSLMTSASFLEVRSVAKIGSFWTETKYFSQHFVYRFEWMCSTALCDAMVLFWLRRDAQARGLVKVGRWTTFVYHTKCAKPVHAHAIARMYGSVERLPVGEGVGGVGAEAVCTLFPGGSMK